MRYITLYLLWLLSTSLQASFLSSGYSLSNYQSMTGEASIESEAKHVDLSIEPSLTEPINNNLQDRTKVSWLVHRMVEEQLPVNLTEIIVQYTLQKPKKEVQKKTIKCDKIKKCCKKYENCLSIAGICSICFCLVVVAYIFVFILHLRMQTAGAGGFIIEEDIFLS
ncbi:MAG: hypothetical protein AAF335_00100 [Bacteroidota bacterium]